MITQHPTPPNKWLYKDEFGQRHFFNIVSRPDGTPPWAECTNEEKEQWESLHPQTEPDEEV